MESTLKDLCYGFLQFYQGLLHELKDVIKSISIRDKLLEVARYLTTRNNEFRREAQNLMNRLVELNEKAERAKDSAADLVRQIKTMTDVILRVLNHENIEQSLETAVQIFIGRTQDMRAKIDNVMRELNVGTEVLEIGIELEYVLGSVRDQETEINTKKASDELWERMKYYGGATVLVGGKFWLLENWEWTLLVLILNNVFIIY